MLDRAGRLTPGGLRSAIARAVMQVAPEKARKRREEAAKDARVQRWAEDSGNAALAGRELPPDEVLAADQRISWWARQLKKAGLAGSMDELRARAYLDLLLDKDSRPAAPADGTTDSSGTTDTSGATDSSGESGSGGNGSSGGNGEQRRERRERRQRRRRSGRRSGDRRVRPPDPPDPAAPMTPPGAGVRPSGFVGRLHLTVPLIDLAGAGGPAGGDPGAGPGRPVAGPRPGPRRRRQPRRPPGA